MQEIINGSFLFKKRNCDIILAMYVELEQLVQAILQMRFLVYKRLYSEY